MYYGKIVKKKMIFVPNKFTNEFSTKQFHNLNLLHGARLRDALVCETISQSKPFSLHDALAPDALAFSYVARSGPHLNCTARRPIDALVCGMNILLSTRPWCMPSHHGTLCHSTIVSMCHGMFVLHDSR
jgi:hypothetical protein